MNEIDKSLEELTELIMNFLREALREKLVIQGHGQRNDSSLIDTMDYVIKQTGNFIIAEMLMQPYFRYVERGVKAVNIPYSGTFRAANRRTKSKYIEGLIKFWRKKGLTDKKAKSAAFATANVHKKEGMPTKNSFKYSKDGTRLKFINSTLELLENDIAKIIERETFKILDINFTQVVNLSLGNIDGIEIK